MSTGLLIGGDEDPLDRHEQREWDRIQFHAIIAPYIGDALFSKARIAPKPHSLRTPIDEYGLPIKLPPEDWSH